MSPFYAAYLRQLTPKSNTNDSAAKPAYASGGKVTNDVMKLFPVHAIANGKGNDYFKNLGGKRGIFGGAMDFFGTSNKFNAQGADLTPGTNAEQLQTAYDQAQSGIAQQQDLANQLAAQGGIQNQSDVYNQFGQIAQGQGPNPAQEMLKQQTGQNIANQSAMLASQRGASANPAALARTAANTGAAAQQNAIGQGAALQAQQSLNALGQQGNIAGQQVSNQMAGVQGVNNAVQNEQNILQNANTAFNNANVSQQAGLNQVNSGVAASNQNAAGQMLGGATKAISSVASMFSDERLKKDLEDGNFDIDKFLDSLHTEQYADGGEVSTPMLEQPQTQVAAPQSNVGQWLSSQTSSEGPQMPQSNGAVQSVDWGLTSGGGGGGGAGGLSSMFSMAEGGEIEDVAKPKSYDYKNPDQPGAAPGRQYGITAQDLEKSPAGASVVHDTPQGKMVDTNHTVGLLLASVGRLNARIRELEASNKKMAEGGKVDALVSPGERYLDRKDVAEVKRGKPVLSVGKVIPGKPKVAGAVDSYKNDTVPKKLEAGGIVIPRSVEQAPDAPKKAEMFVEAVFMGKPKLKKKSK